VTERDDNYHLGLIGNGRTAALVDREGTVCFACLPDFDSDAVLCSLLDRERGGELSIAMVDGRATAQAYLEGTNVLRTVFDGAAGSLEVIDFMPRRAPSRIVRLLRPRSGAPEVVIGYQPQLGFARSETTTRVLRPGVLHSTSKDPDPTSAVLYTNLDCSALRTGDPIVLSDEAYLVLGAELESAPEPEPEPDPEQVRAMLADTVAYWRDWSAEVTAPSHDREAVLRSALVLELMRYEPAGSVVAAPTTSLPEAIGEPRNWDYRFCWLRDGSMTAKAMHRVGRPDMARRFVEWVLDTKPTENEPLQIMYGIRGERTLTEQTLTHLSGYQGSTPVRVGNAAYDQRQHDIYGAVLDVVLLTLDHFRDRPEVTEQLWALTRRVMATVEQIWQRPDRGIWEFRGVERHFVFSKLLCWVAADRAVEIAEQLGHRDCAAAYRLLAAAVRADVLEHGWSERLGAFAQSYGSDEPDASNLLMVDYGLLAADDPRYVATVERTWEVLGRGEGLLMRYRAADDFGEPHSAFTICCFWGVRALVYIGQIERARAAFDRLLSDRNHVGLLGEDLHLTTRRQLGNFPQAYSHLALIETALALAAATGRPRSR